MVGSVGGIDFGRIGCDAKVKVEVDDGVATILIGNGICIET